MTKLDQQAKDQRIQRQRERLADLEALRMSVEIELYELLERTGGEVTPEVDRLAEKLLEYDERISDKLDRYAYVIKSLEADRDRITERAMVLSLRAKSLDKTVERLKETCLAYIKANVEPDEKGRRRVACELHTLWIQANGGAVPLEIDDIDPEDVPLHYQRQEISFDTDAIRLALAAGNKLSFAKLGERGVHLRIS